MIKHWIARATISLNLLIISNYAYADRPPSYYTLAPITEIRPGNFGNARLYYQEACNQEFVSTLTEAQDASSFNAGILTRIYPSGCTRPQKTRMTTVKHNGAEIIPVTEFAEVWHCQSSCTIFVNGRPQSYALEAFGTSADQTRSDMYCSGIQTDLTCQQIDIQ